MVVAPALGGLWASVRRSWRAGKCAPRCSSVGMGLHSRCPPPPTLCCLAVGMPLGVCSLPGPRGNRMVLSIHFLILVGISFLLVFSYKYFFVMWYFLLKNKIYLDLFDRTVSCIFIPLQHASLLPSESLFTILFDSSCYAFLKCQVALRCPHLNIQC